MGFGIIWCRSRVVCEVVVELGGLCEEMIKKVEVGNWICVFGLLKVFYVFKYLELDIGGFEGEVKEVVIMFKGKFVFVIFFYKV